MTSQHESPEVNQFDDADNSVVGTRAQATPALAAQGMASTFANKSTLPPLHSPIDQAKLLLDMRLKKKRIFIVKFAICVLLPTVLAFAYLLFFASPVYTSEFQVTYQTYRAPNSLATGLVQSLAGTSQSNTVDLGTIVNEYINSAAILSKIDAKINLRSHFSNPSLDYFSRLNPGASQSEFLSYYHRHVVSSIGLGGYLTIHVYAFDSQFSYDLAKVIVHECDLMVDDITSRARNDEMAFAEAEVSRQEERVRRSLQAITDFQNSLGDQDPQRVATQLGQIVGTLETDLATARAQLSSTDPYLKPNSPLVIQMKSRISSLEQQLSHEQSRLANTGGKIPYSQILSQYASLQLEQEFAKTAYLSSQQGLSVARADAARKQNYLIDFVPPTKPDKSDRSYMIYYMLTVFLGSLIAFAFGSLIIGAFRDQAGI